MKYSSEIRSILANKACVLGKKYGWYERWEHDRELWLETIKDGDLDLRDLEEFDRYLAKELSNDRELILEAVKRNGHDLEYASRKLKNDFEVVMEAVKNRGLSLYHASKKLKNNFDIVMEAVKNDGEALIYASDEMKNNPNIALEAVKNNGYALKYIGEGLERNRDILLHAIKNMEGKEEQAMVIFDRFDDAKYNFEEIIDKEENRELYDLIANSMVGSYELYKYANMDNYKEKYYELDLPDNMYVGIHFESAGKYSEAMANGAVVLATEVDSDWPWEAKYNRFNKSIKIESPIFGYDEEDNEIFADEIYTLCNKLTNLGQVTNRRCRAEIDIYTDYLKNKEVRDNLNEIWGNVEEIIFKMCNEKGELPVKELNEYSGLMVDGGKATIDLSNSTINPNTWIENITLYGRIIDASQKITDIEKKDNLTEEEKYMLDLRSKLSEEIPEEEKMEVLLDMLFVEEEKEVYRERYEETIKSIEQNPRSKRLFTREDVTISKEVNEFKDLAMQEKESDIDKIEKDFVDEKQKSLNQEVDIER